MSDQTQPGKIIIDTDWKEQVAREKESLRSAPLNSPGGDPADLPDASQEFREELPEASLLVLIINMATQAMIALGQVPDPIQGTADVDLQVAKFHIDMMGVLQQKTKGNLDAEESRYLESTLSQLRLAFVAVSRSS